MSESTDRIDDRVISLLRHGLAEADPVPTDTTEFAKASLSWRTIDAELAQIAYDSSQEPATSGVRSMATARILSFEAGNWMIDVEYNSATGRLLGQIDPRRRVTVELHLAGDAIITDTDELGRFRFEGVLPGPVSLVFRTPDDLEVIKTEWTVL